MAVREQSGDHPREKIMKTDNKNDKKVYLVAQELKLARVLAGNNKTSRDKALKSLKKWFAHRSKTLPFTDNDFQIIWKGLFYSMWMSDKPLIQEECAENIASLIHFETIDESLLFFKAGLTTLINEWFGIDQLRLDKFLMLVRRLLRHMLIALKNHGFSKKNIDKFSEVVFYTILNTDIRPPVGLFMHFTEIYIEEISKITNGNIHSERLVDFIQPFIKKLVVSNDGREIAHIKKFIFTHLIKQSDMGLEYQAKYDAWKQEGFPGTIDSMQKIKLDDDVRMSDEEDSENKDEEKPLDPRAGRVDVELPQIRFKAKYIVNALVECKFSKDGNSKSRRTISELVNLFTKMSKGVYPLGVKKVLDTDKNSYDASIRKAANRLIKFDNKLLGKEKKKRRRSKENGEEKVAVPQKRRKKDALTDQNSDDESESLDGDDVDQEDLEKFIEQSEGNVTKKTKKKKLEKRGHDAVDEKVSLNGDEVSEEELEDFIAQSEDKLEKKIKKTKKISEKSAANRKAAVNGDDASEEEPEESMAGGKGIPGIKSKKNKIVEKRQKNINDSSIKSETNVKRKRRNESNTDKETKRKKRNREEPNEVIIDNIECVFERNSGTWVVYDVSRDKENIDVPSQQTEIDKESFVSPVKDEEGPSTSSTNAENSEAVSSPDKSPSMFSADLGSPSDGSETPSKNRTSLQKNDAAESGSPKSGVSPVRLFESLQKTKELFPKSPWDEPLQEGEYEICIPSKKRVAKLKKEAKKNNQSVHELINISMKQIRGKGRLSLDSKIVLDPFSAPSSSKKVKINTKLNKSQEIHEHVQQILSSPGIPYDANKKPLKPLLKASANSTPVNPFYNKQLNVW